MNNFDGNLAYRYGFEEGRRCGGSRAVIERTPITLPAKGTLRVLYVQQGFETIDLGILRALQVTAGEIQSTSPAGMLELAISWRPDLVLVMNALHVFPPDHKEHIERIRSLGIRTAVWFVDDPYFSDDTLTLATHYDVVFTHEQSCISHYKASGCPLVYYLPLAADTEMFYPQMTSLSYQSDVCFIGNAFRNRLRLFDELAPYLSQKRLKIVGGNWDGLTRRNLLDPYIHDGWIPAEETARYYNGAKIVINLHRPTEAGSDNRNGRGIPGYSINPRTYEINACGTLQITDVRADLGQYYRPGYDIETFSSPAELCSKIEYYLTHEDHRLEVAWRALWTTRVRHSYTDRVSRLLELALP